MSGNSTQTMFCGSVYAKNVVPVLLTPFLMSSKWQHFIEKDKWQKLIENNRNKPYIQRLQSGQSIVIY